jgi:aminoglycoside phosphotransferase family enzyme
VYLGVVDIVERDGTYVVGGPGRPVEPAVWMRRLPERGMLPALLARDAVGPRLVRRIGRRLAEFHAVAATGAGVDDHGGLATVRANWEENFAQTSTFVGRTQIVDYVERFLVDKQELLERRVVEGRIREGHGDLHAGSICVEGQRVQLFDCLEFAARFRCSDVAAEVAFLAMDFDHYGRADLGAVFVDEYIRRSGDEELIKLLDFYKCYRAYVRGKVASLRLDEPQLSTQDQSAIVSDARTYFDLAWTYAGGLPGGKDGPSSTVSRPTISRGRSCATEGYVAAESRA